MRSGFLVVTLVALGSAASACGGSSSETPFPIEPNQAELRSGMLTRERQLPAGRKKDTRRRNAEESDETEPEGATGEAAEGAADEAVEQSPATGSDSPNSRGAESDAGVATPGGALPTWGGPQAPKR